MASLPMYVAIRIPANGGALEIAASNGNVDVVTAAAERVKSATPTDEVIVLERYSVITRVVSVEAALEPHVRDRFSQKGVPPGDD